MEDSLSSCYKAEEEIVWAKGDKCLSPYSGDEKLYKAVVKKISRSSVGQVVACVKFDGYGDDESEDIDIRKLQRVKGKVNESATRADKSSAPSGMFKPLQGSELQDRLKEKYGSVDDDSVSVKTEHLSDLVFHGKSSGTRLGSGGSGSRSNKSGGQSKKGVVATGGEPVKAHSTIRRPSPGNKKKWLEGIEDAVTSPSTKKKCHLDVRGGAAVDFAKELRTSKRLSDISSVVDPVSVQHALDKQRYDSNTDVSAAAADDDNVDAAADDNDIVEGDIEGFDEEDMEKPRFTYKPEGAKVPYILSHNGETPVVQVPASVNQYLRDYQREGINFLYSHYKYDRGAILGDDMGLGKTVQVIGFLSALLGKQGNRVDVMRQKPRFIRKLSDSACIKDDAVTRDPFLIIGPGCVLYNWIDELETWGYFTVRKYHGADKAECLADVKKGKLEIVVTTFETFREHQDSLNAINWSAVIVDEVHKIKGLKAQTTKALRTLNTRRRYGLTGTALQNNLLEFWSLLDWAQPGCLGRQTDFEVEYVHAIEGGQRHDANKRELALARKKKEKFAEIRRGMMIRRLKTLIADQLPKKDDNVVFCKLSQLQTSIYKTILNNPSMHLVLHKDDPCSCDSGKQQGKCCFKKTPEGESVKSLMFTFMHLLLKTSNHVALLIPTNKTSEKQAKQSRKICEAAFKEHPEFVAQTKEASFKTLSDPKYCGKMKILQGLLKVFCKEHSKVLLFSYSTQVLDIIEQYLMSTGYEYRRIDGAVSARKRLTIVKEFNSDPNIFICIISTKAGGLGLNLTGANKVVIFDPNWNPTHDLQAQDRAYRIGQRRNVQVFRLVTAGTIEENMYLRQIYKQQLLNVTVEDENARRYFYAVQGSRKQKGELFGVNNMFQLQTGESCLTMDILKRNERVESALAGFEITRYLPPVISTDEEEDSSDDKADTATSESEEDVFAQFFSSQGPVNDDEINLLDENINTGYPSAGSANILKKSSAKGNNSRLRKKSSEERESNNDECDTSVDVKTAKRKKCVSFKEIDSVNMDETNTVSLKTPQNKGKVRFETSVRTSVGKVQPSKSVTGKALLKKKAETDDEDTCTKFDQTLAGTFNDVSDVFDNCGVVHIHENVKVVGGSKAEDHMTRCAITDVYELHQNSQDLAVQCELLSESSEDEVPEPAQQGRRRKQPINDHNTIRSTVIGKMKVLIGQTPKGFRIKHVEGMSQFHKSGSLLEFAELVLNSSLEERVVLLNSYYGNMDPALKDIFQTNENRLLESMTHKDRSDSNKKKSSTNKKRHQQKEKNAQSISFLDEAFSEDSKSNSLTANIDRQLKTENDASMEEDSSMDIGLNLSPGRRKRTVCMKRTPQRQTQRLWTGDRYHSAVPPSYLEYGRESMEKVLDSKGRYGFGEKDAKTSRIKNISGNQNTFADECDIDSSVLLDEMGKESEENSHEHDSVIAWDSIDGNAGDNSCKFHKQTARATDFQDKRKCQNLKEKHGKRTITNIEDDDAVALGNYELKKKVKSGNLNSFESDEKSATKQQSEISILDALFTHTTTNSPIKRKPPPSKSKHAINENKPKIVQAESNKLNNEFDPFKVVDDIFSEGADVSDTDALLANNTLKDDSYDCFDDPKMWKRRKRKVLPDERNIVDKLIADSDAEYADLFTSGKMRRREIRQEESNKNKELSADEVDGSLSLFS